MEAWHIPAWLCRVLIPALEIWEDQLFKVNLSYTVSLRDIAQLDIQEIVSKGKKSFSSEA